MAPDLGTMLASCDAALLIGDPALLVQRARYATVIDLAEEWRKHTGKPFVFAFWAVREEALSDAGAGGGRSADAVLRLAEVFQCSRDHGLTAASIGCVANEWAPRLGMSMADVTSYLTENIHYSLDKACREGLALFYKYAEACGSLPVANFSP
jgi:chorismate dehydratase